MNHMDFSKLVVNKAKEILDESKYEFRIVYNGKSIEIVSSEDCEYRDRIYLRIVKTIKDNYIIDISNIDLDKKHQKTGIFTLLVKKFKELEPENIWVSSAFTDGINIACQKLGFTKDEIIMGYKVKK